MTGRPQFFAPQVRLVDVDSGRVVGQRGTPAMADISLSRLIVTQNHHLTSIVEATLNNQRFDAHARSVHPPWKYNTLGSDTNIPAEDRTGQITFGQQVRAEVRYGDEPWTALIVFRVMNLEFTFPGGESPAAAVKVTGEDALSLLKINPTADHTYRGNTVRELGVLEDVLRRAQVSGLAIADPRLPRPGFTHDSGAQMPGLQHPKTKTFLDFMKELCERIDFELFVELERGGSASQPTWTPRLHFEPARSLVPPDDALQVVDLVWGRNLIDFKPTFKVWEQYTQALAGGTQQQQADRVSQAVSAVTDDLQHLPGEPEPIDAVSLRRRWFSAQGHPENMVALNLAGMDPDRARLAATAALRARAREFLTVTGSTIGFPSLRPGIHANVSGLYAPFDGLYYVTQAKHEITDEGYRTRFSLRRPGMLDPALYPGGRARLASEIQAERNPNP